MAYLPESDLHEVVAQVGADWERLRGARIFLTGGTGFFGIWLTESFVEANRTLGLGAELVVLTRDPDAFLRRHPHLASVSGLGFHRGDVRDFSAPAGRFSHVIHAATPVVPLDTPKAAWETLDIILAGTRRVLDFAASAGIERFLLVSSGAVYGSQPESLAGFPEAWTGAPDTGSVAAAYGEGKRVAETLCTRHAALHGYALSVARCFAFVGPGLPLDGHFAIGNFIRDALAGAPPVVRGNPNTVRSYLYASDLAARLWCLLAAESPPAVVNVGSDQAVTLGELAARITRLLLPQATAPVFPAGPPGPRYVPDLTRARAHFSHHAAVSLDDAILRTARHAQFSKS